MPYLETNGTKIFFEQHGKGNPALVFIHGFTCDHSDWEYQVDFFRGRNSVLISDLRGHGFSPEVPDHSDITSCASDVAEIIENSGYREVVLVGHSMGCRIALQAYSDSPERVKGISLIEGSLAGVTGTKPRIEQQALERIAGSGYGGMMRRFFTDMFTEGSDPVLKDRIIQRAVSFPEITAVPLYVSILCWDGLRSEGILSQLKVPVQVIQSTFVNRERLRVTLNPGDTTPWIDLIKAYQPEARVDIISDTGHFPMLERPDEVNRMLSEFVESL